MTTVSLASSNSSALVLIPTSVQPGSTSLHSDTFLALMTLPCQLLLHAAAALRSKSFILSRPNGSSPLPHLPHPLLSKLFFVCFLYNLYDGRATWQPLALVSTLELADDFHFLEPSGFHGRFLKTLVFPFCVDPISNSLTGSSSCNLL